MLCTASHGATLIMSLNFADFYGKGELEMAAQAKEREADK
jgi:hypothetical protein